MAIGLVKKETQVAIVREVTEGVPVAPTGGDDFIQVLEDGLEVVPSKELVERTILTQSIGQITPRTSTRGVTNTIPVEWRAGGVEGNQPDYFELINATLGGQNTNASSVTDGTLGTTTTFEQTGTVLVKGDFIVLEISMAWHMAFVTDVTGSTVTFAPAAAAAVPATTTISASQTYFPINSGQPTLTTHMFWGNEIQETSNGVRVASMALENATTGAIPMLSFGCEGLNSDREVATSPFTPIFSSNEPPIMLGATVQQGDVCIDLNEIGFSLENALSFLTSVKDPEGKVSSRYVSRAISGTMNPYLQDDNTDFWDKFLTDELFSIIITLANPDPANPGQFIPGTHQGIFLPNSLLTEDAIGDVDLLLVENLAFNSNIGPGGDQIDIFLGFS